MASTSSSSPPPDKVVETHYRRRTKRARIDDGSRPAAEPTMPAPTGHSSWRDWASLACGPATVIADRVASAADYMSFRAVCGAWRRCTADPRGVDALDRRFHPHGWTIFNDNEWRGASRYIDFQNVSTGDICRMTFRGIDGRALLARTSQGLVVLLNIKTNAACVVNPITGAHADLPPVTTLLTGCRPKLDFLRCPDGAHFSAELTDDSAVPLVVISFGGRRRLGVARPGDERWAIVEGTRQIDGLFSSAGRVYCCSGNTVMVLDTSPDQPPRLVKAFN